MPSGQQKKYFKDETLKLLNLKINNFNNRIYNYNWLKNSTLNYSTLSELVPVPIPYRNQTLKSNFSTTTL